MKDVNILITNGANVKKALELFGDMETYDQTLEVFLSEVPQKIQKIKGRKRDLVDSVVSIDRNITKSLTMEDLQDIFSVD